MGLDPQDAELARGTFLTGAPDRPELLTCTIAGGDQRAISFTVGTVSEDRDEVLEQVREGAHPDAGPIEEIEGDAPGLGEDHVLAVSRDGGEYFAFAWIDGGFLVTLAFPSGVADPERGFAALSEAVDAVRTSLPRS